MGTLNVATGRQRGFTLLELLITCLIFALAASFVSVSTGQLYAFQLRSYSNQVLQHIRHLKHLANLKQHPYGISFTNKNQILVLRFNRLASNLTNSAANHTMVNIGNNPATYWLLDQVLTNSFPKQKSVTMTINDGELPRQNMRLRSTNQKVYFPDLIIYPENENSPFHLSIQHSGLKRIVHFVSDGFSIERKITDA